MIVVGQPLRRTRGTLCDRHIVISIHSAFSPWCLGVIHEKTILDKIKEIISVPSIPVPPPPPVRRAALCHVNTPSNQCVNLLSPVFRAKRDVTFREGVCSILLEKNQGRLHGLPNEQQNNRIYICGRSAAAVYPLAGVRRGWDGGGGGVLMFCMP